MANLSNETRERASMRVQNREPRTPLAAVILTALVIGHTWGMFVLTGGDCEGQGPSTLPSVTTGHLVRSGEGVRR